MLVGDSGYPALPFLLTPIGNPVTDEQIRFEFCIIIITIYKLLLLNIEIFFTVIIRFTGEPGE